MSDSQPAKKILIVEDEPDVASYLEMLLNDGGYETIIAVNGNDGLEKLERDKPGHYEELVESGELEKNLVDPPSDQFLFWSW